MPKLLSPADIARYEKEGYLGPIRVVPEADMARYRERLEAFERAHPEAVGKLFQGPHLLFPWANDLIRESRLLDALEDLYGPDLLCISTGFRIKEPGSPKFVGWHQDAYYLTYRPAWLIALIAFTECTVENGCLEVVPGSHRGPLLRHEDTHDPDSILTQGQRITDPFDEARAVPIALEPGQALLFDSMMIHGSKPNRATSRRITCFADFCPTRTRRVGKWASATLVRGTDACGHFELEPRPEDEFGPRAIALHRRLIQERNKGSYVDPDRLSPALG